MFSYRDLIIYLLEILLTLKATPSTERKKIEEKRNKEIW